MEPDIKELRNRLEKQIESIEKHTKMLIESQHDAEINLWFNDKLIKFLKQELGELPECPVEEENLDNSVIK